MKIVKIVLGIVAALWAVAYLPKVFGDASQYGDLAFSHRMGSVVGILISSAISIVLFRSALKN
jgi:hypothetical protein